MAPTNTRSWSEPPSEMIRRFISLPVARLAGRYTWCYSRRSDFRGDYLLPTCCMTSVGLRKGLVARVAFDSIGRTSKTESPSGTRILSHYEPAAANEGLSGLSRAMIAMFKTA